MKNPTPETPLPAAEEVLDPFSLMRPDPVTETRTFMDFQQPGKQLTMTFCAETDHSVALRVARIAAKYNEQFVTGKEGPGGKRVLTPLPPVGDKMVRPDEDLFYQIAYLETLEIAPENRTKYNVFQWVALSVTMPNAFAEIVRWGEGLIDRASHPAEKNASGESLLPND